MPYADPANQYLPYQGTVTAENTSRAGAVAIAPIAGTLRDRYLALLARYSDRGLTDEYAAVLLSVPGRQPVQRTTVIARRHEANALARLNDQPEPVECCGRVMGPHGVGQKTYRLARGER